MRNSHHGAALVSTEIDVLEEAEQWLKQDKEGNDNIADDHVVGIQLIDSVAENNTSGQPNDHQDDTNDLQRSMDEKYTLGEW